MAHCQRPCVLPVGLGSGRGHTAEDLQFGSRQWALRRECFAGERHPLLSPLEMTMQLRATEWAGEVSGAWKVFVMVQERVVDNVDTVVVAKVVARVRRSGVYL